MSLKERRRSKTDNTAYPFNQGSREYYYKDYMGNIGQNSFASYALTPSYDYYRKYGFMKDLIKDQPIRRLGSYPNTLNSDPVFKECWNVNDICSYTPGKPWNHVHETTPTYPHHGYYRGDGNFHSETVKKYGGHASLSASYLVGAYIYPRGYEYQQAPSAIAKLKSMLSDASLLGLKDVNMLAFIGELKDVRQLLNVFKLKHIDDKTASDKFLGVNLGVLPMIGDIRAIINILKNLDNSVQKWNRMAASNRVFNIHASFIDKTFDGTASENGGGYYTTGPFQRRCTYEYTYKQTVKGRAHLYFRAQPMAPDQFSQLRSNLLGFHKVFGAAWELIPFSFVVDWFIKIGNAIDNIEMAAPVLRAEIVSAGYSVEMETTIKVNYTQEFYVGLFSSNVAYDLGQDDYSSKVYYRQAVAPSTLMLNGATMGPMGYSAEVSGYKVAIATALLHQRLRS